MDDEIWKDVPGFEGRYQASDLGRVRSVDRVEVLRSRWGTTMHRKIRGRLLKPQPDKDGYLTVGLYLKPTVRRAKVHVLVATAFVANPRGLPQVDHKNDNRADARATNLQWVTSQENTALMVERGRSAKGEGHGNAKLTRQSVDIARAAWAGGATYVDLGRRFGVSDVAMRNAIQGVTWKI